MDARLKWIENPEQLASDVLAATDRFHKLLQEWEWIEAASLCDGESHSPKKEELWSENVRNLCVSLNVFRNDVKAALALSKRTIPFDPNVLTDLSAALGQWNDDKTDSSWKSLHAAHNRVDIDLAALRTFCLLKPSVPAQEEVSDANSESGKEPPQDSNKPQSSIADGGEAEEPPEKSPYGIVVDRTAKKVHRKGQRYTSCESIDWKKCSDRWYALTAMLNAYPASISSEDAAPKKNKGARRALKNRMNEDLIPIDLMIESGSRWSIQENSSDM
jgi:hypothetical protein